MINDLYPFYEYKEANRKKMRFLALRHLQCLRPLAEAFPTLFWGCYAKQDVIDDDVLIKGLKLKPCKIAH